MVEKNTLVHAVFCGNVALVYVIIKWQLYAKTT